MWISLYHGTTQSTARALANGTVNTSIGGGEFGQGFYMGTSKRLARRRAFHKMHNMKGSPQEAMRLKGNTLHLSLDIPLVRFSYTCRALNLASAIGLYASLKKQGNCATFKDASDALVGPIVGWSRYYQILQYKFQSTRFETAINSGCPHGALRKMKII